MAAMTLGAGAINQARNSLTVALGGATGALTIATPGISVTVGGVAAAIGTITGSGSGATAKVVIPLSSVAPIGEAIVVTFASSGIVDASGDTTPNGSVTVTDTTYILALASATIDISRTKITVPVSGATGALTVGGSPEITVTAGGIGQTVSSVTSSGSGASAALLITLSALIPAGSAIVVTSTGSGIEDASNHQIANGSVTVTDALTANHTPVAAALQTALSNFPMLTNLQNGFFGAVKETGRDEFTIYSIDGNTPLAIVDVDRHTPTWTVIGLRPPNR